MADRTSAELFGLIFELLAEKPTKKTVEIAHKVWDKTSSYDFSPYQMYCDDALITLGLAKTDSEDEIVYKGYDGFDE